MGAVIDVRRAPEPVVEVVGLDAEQVGVLDDDAPVVRVLGGPGTGKTTLAVELVLDRVERRGVPADGALVLAPTRRAAAGLRERVTARLARTTTEPLARTHQALGFAILRAEAALRGAPAPRLLSGPEQDVVLRDLLAGHRADPGRAPRWPAELAEALTTRGFRAELRDLLMRAAEHGVEAAELARLGVEHRRPEWVAAAGVLDEYDQVTALSRPGAFDPAWILTAAADLLEDSPEALDRLRARVRLLVVDDAHELTWPAARLLRTLAHPGLQVVLLGDPDSTVHGFRGADPRLLWWSDWPALTSAPTHVLRTAHGLGAATHTAAGVAARRIGAVGGAQQRSTRAGRSGGSVEVALVRAVAQEARLVATTLRRAHLQDRLPWSQMAVVVRGQGRAATLRRVLAAAGVPVAPSGAQLAVRDEVAVRPLLQLLEIVLRRAVDPTARLDPTTAADLLLSPLGGADAVSLRRVRRALRRAELDAGGRRTSDELLAEAIDGALGGPAADVGALRRGGGDPAEGAGGGAAEGEAAAGVGADRRGPLRADGEPLRRIGAAVRAGVAAARRGPAGSGWAPGVTAETVLWAIWEALEVAGSWRATALRAGPSGLRADRDLDAVLGLFDAAARFTDRLPAAGPDAFLEHIRAEEVPGDTLLERAPLDATVALLTPAAAAGQRWSLVCIAGVQEGVWPDLRLRGSLLGSEALVDVLTGRHRSTEAARAAVRHDETRLLHVALSRAADRLLITAVRSDDEQPSVFLDLLDPLPEDVPIRPFTEVPAPLTLPDLVGTLRREAASDDPVVSTRSARLLARLADEQVPGADPDRWWGVGAGADDRPRRPGELTVRVAPSKLEEFQRCSLRWLLISTGGSGPKSDSASIGTLVHDVVADLGDVDAAELQAEINRRWPQLGLPHTWISERKRREAHAMAARVAAYQATAVRAGWEPVAREARLDVVVGRARLVGSVDRLEQHVRTGALRVIDYKTGATKAAARDVPENPQLAAYQVAIEAGAFPQGTTSGGAALLQVGRNANLSAPDLQQQPPLAEADDPGWAARLVESSAEGMAGGRFVASRGEHCVRCPVRTSCPAWPEGGGL